MEPVNWFAASWKCSDTPNRLMEADGLGDALLGASVCEN